MSVPHLTPVVEAPTAAAAARTLRRRRAAPVGRPTGRADRAVRGRPAAERRGDRRRRGRRRAAVRPRVGLPQPRDARGARPRPPHAPRARPGPLRARRPRQDELAACERCGACAVLPLETAAAIRDAVRDAVGFEPFFHHFPLAGLCAPAARAPARPTSIRPLLHAVSQASAFGQPHPPVRLPHGPVRVPGQFLAVQMNAPVPSPPPDGQQGQKRRRSICRRAFASGRSSACSLIATASAGARRDGGRVRRWRRGHPGARRVRSGDVPGGPLRAPGQLRAAGHVRRAVRRPGEEGLRRATGASREDTRSRSTAATSVTAAMGRGGELHTFTDVTATGFSRGLHPRASTRCCSAGRIPARCARRSIRSRACRGVPRDDGLFPGRTIAVDTSTRGTHLFECMIHPWMRTTVTVD